MEYFEKEHQIAETNQRRQEILLAAKRVFATEGYRRTRVDQIAEAVGLGKGTLYRYFEDKKALFLAVFDDGIHRLHQHIVPLENIENQTRRIKTTIHNYLEFFDNDRELIEIIMQVRSEFRDDYRKMYFQLYHYHILRIENMLRSGVEKGLFRQMDIQTTAESYLSFLHGVLQSFYMKELSGPNSQNIHQKQACLTDMSEAISSLLLEGLLKR